VKRALITLAVAAALLTGCAQSQSQAPAPAAQAPAAQPQQKAPMVNLTAADLLAQVKAGSKPFIVDVRTAEEFAAGHIDGAKNIDLQTIEKGIKAIPKEQEIVLICRSGNRSAQAYDILAQMGYTKLKNVTGGMQAWEQAGGPVVK
jgi:rhodanese-related sulfurtransferase